MENDPIVAFYSGGRDDRLRTLHEILAWSDDRLETAHDYIQWLFPNRTRSPVNVSAPVITDSTVEAFTGRADLRERLAAALDRMLAFYGLRRITDIDGNTRIEIARSIGTVRGDQGRAAMSPG